MIFDEIIEYVEKQFGVKVIAERASNVLFLKVNGIDDVSLARYINQKFDISIVTHKVEGYKFYNNDWIKIEDVVTKVPS